MGCCEVSPSAINVFTKEKRQLTLKQDAQLALQELSGGVGKWEGSRLRKLFDKCDVKACRGATRLRSALLDTTCSNTVQALLKNLPSPAQPPSDS